MAGYLWAKDKLSPTKPNQQTKTKETLSNQKQKQEQEEEIPDQLKELNQEFQRIVEQIRKEKVPVIKPFIEFDYSEESDAESEPEPESPEIIALNRRLAAQQAWESEKLEREKAHLLAKRKEKQRLAREKELERHKMIKLDREKKLRGNNNQEEDSN